MIIERIELVSFSKFILVGVLNTVIGYSLFAFLVYFGFFYLLALTISHIFGTVHSYLWNRIFTFKSTGDLKKELPKFICVYVLIYLINFLLLFLAVENFNLDALFAQLFILMIVVLISFLLQKFWAFRT